MAVCDYCLMSVSDFIIISVQIISFVYLCNGPYNNKCPYKNNEL